jgi:hypothetical protein
MAGGLESALKITAKDETGGAFKALKAQVDAIDKQIAVFDKMAEAVGKIAPAADPLIKAIAESTKALEQQEAAAAAAAEGLGAIEGAAGAAAGGQERLRAAVMETSRVIAVQGAEAARVAEKIVQAQRRGGGAREGRGGFWSEMRGLAPFAAPEGAHVWGEALGAGATIDNSLARLRASNLASPEDIAMARADYLDFSKTHTGVTEAEYIESFREALSNAPREESFHLAGQMATIKPPCATAAFHRPRKITSRPSAQWTSSDSRPRPSGIATSKKRPRCGRFLATKSRCRPTCRRSRMRTRQRTTGRTSSSIATFRPCCR